MLWLKVKGSCTNGSGAAWFLLYYLMVFTKIADAFAGILVNIWVGLDIVWLCCSCQLDSSSCYCCPCAIHSCHHLSWTRIFEYLSPFSSFEKNWENQLFLAQDGIMDPLGKWASCGTCMMKILNWPEAVVTDISAESSAEHVHLTKQSKPDNHLVCIELSPLKEALVVGPELWLPISMVIVVKEA